MPVTYHRHPPPEGTQTWGNQQWLPDFGELSNPAWAQALNVVPYANGWLIAAPLIERTQLVSTDIIGFAVHPSNGTNNWLIYYGTPHRLYEVEPATWVGTDRTEYATVAQGWQEDNGGGPSYVDLTAALNSAGASDAQPFPSGAGGNDAVYFGFTDAISLLVVVVGTAGVGAYTVTWEYWNGSAWTALASVTDGTDAFKNIGSADVTFTLPTNWAATTVNGSSSLYFLRARRDANTVTTNPLLTSAKASTSYANYLTAWQFLPYGNHMVAAGGHDREAKIRVDDSGNFIDLVTNSEPVIPGGAASGNWPPKPRFIAQWGLALCMANINDTGPANAFDDASGINSSLLWVSDKTGRIWSITEEDDGTGLAATLDNAAAVDNGDGLVGIPATGHGLEAGNTVTIADTTNYDGIHTLDATTSVNELVIPATYNAETFAGTETATRLGGTTYNSHRSTFLYLTDQHGEITALAGGEEFGVVGKATAVYRATYGGTFRADVSVASAEIGWVFPNAGAWGPDHEFYFWSTAGPAVMTHSGVQVLGIGRWQRTLFDPSYIFDTYVMNNDQSARYLLFCAYSRATDVVTWWYRRDQDIPDMAFHFHRGTGRASAQVAGRLVDTVTDWPGLVYGVATIPYSETTDFTGLKDILIVSRDSDGNAHIYQPGTSGTVKWMSKPTLETGYLELGQGKATVLRVRPRYSLNSGGSLPQVTITLDSKQLAAGAASSQNQKSSSTVDASTGMVHLTGAISALFNRVKMELGNASVENIESIAEIEGFDIVYDPGEAP